MSITTEEGERIERLPRDLSRAAFALRWARGEHEAWLSFVVVYDALRDQLDAIFEKEAAP